VTPEPPSTPDPPPSPGSASGLDAFHNNEIASHGSHLLSPILQSEDGARSALCPVCRTAEPLLSEGGWLNVRCQTCGTEFMATDGSPPPAVLPPPPALPTPVPSPIAPTSPLEPLPPPTDLPRSFTSDVYTDADGRRRVACPQCHGALIDVPRGARVAVVLRCPVCHGPFLVGLSSPEPEPLELPDPEMSPLPPLPFNPDGRLWYHCPKCGYESLTPGRMGAAFILTCGVCGQRILVSEGPHPPRPPALPAPPSIWERIWRLFGGG